MNMTKVQNDTNMHSMAQAAYYKMYRQQIVLILLLAAITSDYCVSDMQAGKAWGVYFLDSGFRSTPCRLLE